jgi:hypothetical protein
MKKQTKKIEKLNVKKVVISKLESTFVKGGLLDNYAGKCSAYKPQSKDC